MLPNARIIDARRHPLSCCFSVFKQHFARGQAFTYGLEDIGRYYRDYVDLMAHFDRVLPGRVHRVIYERMVDDTESEVRRLLEYCGLPFEEACLRFYENDRAVRTASSEQVRQTHIPRIGRSVAQLRHLAAAPARCARTRSRCLSGRPDPFKLVRRLTYTPANHQAPGGSHAALAPSEVGPKHHPAPGTAGSHQPLRIHPRCIRTTGVDDCGRPRRNHRHRAEARGKPAERADQHPGHRTANGSISCRSRTSPTTSSSCRACRSRASAQASACRISAASRAARTTTTRARSPASACTSTSSRSRRSRARSTSTCTTSSASKRWRVRRARCTARVRRRARSASSRTSRIRAASRPATTSKSTPSTTAVTGYVAEGFVNLPMSRHAPQCAWSVGTSTTPATSTTSLERVRTIRTRAYPGATCISNAKTPPQGCISTPTPRQERLQRRRDLRRRGPRSRST